MEIFWYTQKTPTQKSATARFARKKLVMERRRREKVTTRITIKLPATHSTTSSREAYSNSAISVLPNHTTRRREVHK